MVKLVIPTWEEMDGDSLPFIHEIEWETINLSLVLSFLTNVVGEHMLRNKTYPLQTMSRLLCPFGAESKSC